MIVTDNLNYDEDTVPEISSEQLSFYSHWQQLKDPSTGVPEPSEVIEAIVRVWKDVKKQFHTFRCIQTMSFLSPRAYKHTAYKAILEMNTSAPDKIKIADIGCCFAQDTRQLILDGVSPSNIWDIDLLSGYWDAGTQMFRDEDHSSPIHLVNTFFGDMTLELHDETAIERILGEGVVFEAFDFVILQAVLHTISREQSARFLSRIFKMLRGREESAGESGILMGTCVGSKIGKDWLLTPDKTASRYLHSPETLTEALVAIGFRNVIVSETQWSLVGGNGKEQAEWSDNIYLEFQASK
jgi:hypothetical protein